MSRIRGVAFLGILVHVLVASAPAADQPIAGTKLTLVRSASGKEKLTFVSWDPAFLFPAIASADDPGTGTPGGALFEIASVAEPSGAGFAAPAVVGKPGWRVKDGAVDSHLYSDPAAAPGPSALETIVLKQGTRIKIVARGVGLALAGPQGTVGVRLTTGTLRSCALFDAASIRQDEPGRLVARGAVASALADCTSLLPPPQTTTSSTAAATTTTSTTLIFDPCTGGAAFPTCDGVCPVDQSCQQTLDLTAPSHVLCLCYPTGVTPCAQSAYPACAGACSGGGVCQAFRDLQLGFTVCGCVAPSAQCNSPGGAGTCTFGRCPPGLVCVTANQPAPLCACGTP